MMINVVDIDEMNSFVQSMDSFLFGIILSDKLISLSRKVHYQLNYYYYCYFDLNVHCNNHKENRNKSKRQEKSFFFGNSD